MTALDIVTRYSAAWVQDCRTYRDRVLTGQYAHWCPHWHGLPMDETCPEWPCACAPELQRAPPDPPHTLFED